MQVQTGLRPQDILILIVYLFRSPQMTNQAQISDYTGISRSEVCRAKKRLIYNGLLDSYSDCVNYHQMQDFVLDHLDLIYPAQVLGYGKGHPLPTGGMFGDYVLWDTGEDLVEGFLIRPLYPTVPYAFREDLEVLEIVGLIELLRMKTLPFKEEVREELRKRFEGQAYRVGLLERDGPEINT